ncbi:MAG: hypothetical protein CMK59_03705, partial [Proteobacteria bacterium]|nr:hypothetical protein [Pseudomonadota bacterium]
LKGVLRVKVEVKKSRTHLKAVSLRGKEEPNHLKREEIKVQKGVSEVDHLQEDLNVRVTGDRYYST